MPESLLSLHLRKRKRPPQEGGEGETDVVRKKRPYKRKSKLTHFSEEGEDPVADEASRDLSRDNSLGESHDHSAATSEQRVNEEGVGGAGEWTDDEEEEEGGTMRPPSAKRAPPSLMKYASSIR